MNIELAVALASDHFSQFAKDPMYKQGVVSHFIQEELDSSSEQIKAFLNMVDSEELHTCDR